MKLKTTLCASLALLALTACEQTPEQDTASAEKVAKQGAEDGHTEVQQLGELLAADGWARETAEGATTGGAFLTIVNGTHNGDKLISANADFAENTSLHKTSEVDGVMTMAPIDDGLPIPSGATLKLEPGGLHIMFMGLKEPLKAGDVKLVTLTFQQAGDKKVPIIVRSLAQGPVTDIEEDGHDMTSEGHMANDES